jgi:hypothetical protein
MAHALADAIEGTLWMPYAIEVDGHVIRMFDAHTHHKVADAGPDVDRRWVKMRTPFVVAGGELTLTDLDLYRTDTPRFYEAPFQMKSNGGVLLIDDLGRQRCSAKQLLNRWIIPLENHVDYLTLSTGQKIQVPFEQLVVFATNLTEPDLADEAFLRRMGYRLYVSAPSVETYTEIFQHCAKSFNLPVAPEIIDRLLACYRADKRIMKCCEPRDLILRSVEVCKYRQQAPRLDPELLAVAWKSYFGTAANLH